MLRCCILVGFAVYLVCSVGANDSLSELPQDKMNNNQPNFVNMAIKKLWKERKKMKYTPLEKIEIAGYPNVEFYFKLEYNSPTGNLKHRFAWCLFVWVITEGYVKKGTPIYEASSGNTATSEAYFAQLLGLLFVAVVPNTTAPDKIERIKYYNGTVIECSAAEIFERAAAEARKYNGFSRTSLLTQIQLKNIEIVSRKNSRRAQQRSY
ncbi:PALP domain-containing protein [Aphelenchoides besseyi]|nr:PALP domain-containing protein [Aphelenchoides besseyi]KAI6211551.1 PALP domain-containing protein [Aphelenchoides besseyi]